jgi:colanic acid/amylovoran biosynthesis glycosyltransferase
MPKVLRVGYLVNQYPAVSHSFIRREIAALESAGAAVLRFSIRKSESNLPDRLDREEQSRTRVLLTGGFLKPIASLTWLLATRPKRLMNALSIVFGNVRWSIKNVVRRLAYLAEAAELVRQFELDPIDHLHAHFGTNPAFVARLVFRLGGPPYSFTAHGPDEFDRPEELDLAGKIADARFAVAISQFGRSQLMRWSDPTHWGAIKVVRCGLDDSFLKAEATPLPASPTLCCVARLSGQKGLPVLVEAAAILKRRGIRFEIVVVGDGELRRVLEDEITSRDLREELNLVGWKSGAEVRKQITESRALVVPSFGEGLPVVIMEAYSLGRPVIATRIAGIPELVDEDCGWIISPGSAVDLADAMEKALAAPITSIERLGMEGRSRVKQLHDVQTNAIYLKSLIEEAVLQEGRS